MAGDTLTAVGPLYPEFFGRPFDDEPFAMFMVQVGGRELGGAVRSIRGRSLDQGLGEIRRPMAFVPRIAVELPTSRVLWRQGERSRVMHGSGDAPRA